MGLFKSDFTFALRSLTKRPVQSLVYVSSLALGIGAHRSLQSRPRSARPVPPVRGAPSTPNGAILGNTELPKA